ncbi:MAG TPA: hypothetical protein PKV86_03030 [Syntrophobacteraceae bacterium]|nr:hypothetical protein [Syntrophobacteraceae bacterium]
MKVAAVLFVLLSAFLICNTASAADWVLYDNFNTATINPLKWFGNEWTEFLTVEENTRMIEKNTLHLLSRIYGQTGSNTGDSEGGNRLRFRDANPIYGIKATFKAKDISVVNCPGNPAPSWAQARLMGYFFNIGTPTPGSSLNDVYAQIRMIASGENELTVTARVSLCNDAACNNATTIGTQTLGTAKRNKKTTLSMEWDQANNRFIFQRDKQTPVYINYTYDDSSPPGTSNNKRLDAAGGAANCTSNPRPSAFIDVFFDNVYVKTTAAFPGPDEE